MKHVVGVNTIQPEEFLDDVSSERAGEASSGSERVEAGVVGASARLARFR